MKIVKAVVAIMLAIIFAFITRYYMASINLEIVGEFTPIPHFFTDVDMSYQFSLLLFIVVYLLFFGYLVMSKYFNFVMSMIGVVFGLIKYKAVAETFLPMNMAFVPSLLELGKILCVFMAIGIVGQWIIDGGLAAVRLVNKNKK